ncbi:cobalt-precorrin-6A reductase [Corynebacterium sp. sy017]|uniref:cobalt-precorrin-6A reductase n=1 Tax=unclassified Corynebacterium TaxID=2624378 RepID=UPI001185EFAB|nr:MULTISPECIES: cobalt-precorrin-6A reductase [unclassified Corynebacterium]MBP3087597.1 cobalt-precorrin-6A reductase [Corynebacterium sp. sy017]TSD92167.1 cobalt-precorrin-6A reductase [Corynebacterium sp. SY003]
MRALILGGTHEARQLAQELYEYGWYVTSSLAGRVTHPRLPVGEVHIGGFGGPAGLAAWLLTHGIELIIDATHPFAERISISASEAARATGIPLIALRRPGWQPQARDKWVSVDSMSKAAEVCAQQFHHIFLTIGRQQLTHFAHDPYNLYVIRCVEKPSCPLPPRHRLILSRGPFEVTTEKKIMRDNQIDCVVTKNSGGQLTQAKLTAARELGISVVMIQRPILPKASYEATSVDDAMRYISMLA